jgi:hypothetical protein
MTVLHFRRGHGSINFIESKGLARSQLRRWLRKDLGNVTVLPLIPMPMEIFADKATLRSLLEFFNWFRFLLDLEARLLEQYRVAQ